MTTMSVADCRAQLEQRLQRATTDRTGHSRNDGLGRGITGEVSDAGFRLHPVYFGRASPLDACGRFFATQQGTRIVLRLRVRPSAVTFVGLFLSLSLATEIILLGGRAMPRGPTQGFPEVLEVVPIGFIGIGLYVYSVVRRASRQDQSWLLNFIRETLGANSTEAGIQSSGHA